MPIQYQPATDRRHFKDRFDLDCSTEAATVRPDDQGIFVRRPRSDGLGTNASARYEAASGRWGLIPLFSKDGQDAGTAEARSESAASERNFYQPWKRGHRCVVLADALFRHGDSDDEMVRVSRADGLPLAIAGLWNGWRAPTGECVESFAMLTLSAEDRPGQRWVVFLRDAWVDDWLHCPVEETAAFLRPYALDKLVRETVPRGAAMPAAALAGSV
jgi:putative SOS response-associated peptidase YedK